MSEKLPLPVRRVLREPMSDEAIDRLVSSAAIPTRSHARLIALSGALALAALALFVVWPRDVAPGPLRDTAGTALAERIDAHVPTSIALDDGSTLALGETAVLATLENDAHDVSFLLEEGSVTFDVRPHGPRHWSIECGLAVVSVVGTRFTITRASHRLAVSVERGIVLVRGERVPDHARRLAAGEQIEITDVETPPVTPPPAVVEIPPPPTPDPIAVAHPPRWRALAAETRWDDAYRALGPAGIGGAADRASVDDLLVLADVARLSGHLADAVSPLERVVAEHPTDPHASLAAFSLGRIEDRLAHPDRAAAAFARARSLGQLPAALRGDALARRATSLELAGDHADAVASARTYLSELPSGPEVSAMRAIEERP